MKFTRYSKFKGLDISSLNLGDLMESLSDSLLGSGYDEDYYWTRERRPQDTSLDALRRALLQALMDQGLLEQRQIQEMLADNEGKFKGSLLEEMLNQLIERLVEEGYLKLSEEPPQQQGASLARESGAGMSEIVTCESFTGAIHARRPDAIHPVGLGRVSATRPVALCGARIYRDKSVSTDSVDCPGCRKRLSMIGEKHG